MYKNRNIYFIVSIYAKTVYYTLIWYLKDNTFKMYLAHRWCWLMPVFKQLFTYKHQQQLPGILRDQINSMNCFYVLALIRCCRTGVMLVYLLILFKISQAISYLVQMKARHVCVVWHGFFGFVFWGCAIWEGSVYVYKTVMREPIIAELI